MNTKSLSDARTECAYERRNDAHEPYVCGKPAVVLWVVEECISVPVCKSCKNWIETLESVGQKP